MRVTLWKNIWVNKWGYIAHMKDFENVYNIVS